MFVMVPYAMWEINGYCGLVKVSNKYFKHEDI